MLAVVAFGAGAVGAIPPVEGQTREAAVQLAREALGSRLEVKAEEIMVQDAVATEWPDASLGCPQKGMVYTQSLVPGFKVQLRWEDRVFDLRVGEGRAIVCDRPDGASRAGLTSASARLYKMARKDLAGRLNLEEKAVKVNVVRATTWPDDRLGCPGPEPGPEAPREVRGFKIELTAAGKTYTYHADADKVVMCQ